MLSSPPPPPPSSALVLSISNKTSDLSATAITPGSNHHPQPTTNGHHLHHSHHLHQHGEMSPSTPSIGMTPIEVNNNNNNNVTTSTNNSSPSSPISVTNSSSLRKDCVSCHRPIRDRYLMCVNERYWHEACLQCTVCRIILTNSCFVKERKIYCKSDYNKLYAAKCSSCLDFINPDEFVMRVQNYVYHVACFICIWCKRQLKKGDKFTLRGHQPICEQDLTRENCSTQLQQSSLYGSEPITASSLNSKDLITYDPLVNGMSHSPSLETSHLTMLRPPHTPHTQESTDPYSPRTMTAICDSTGSLMVKNEPYSSPSQSTLSANSCNTNQIIAISNNSSNTISIKQDGRRGPKRPRTILTTAQRRAFKASFEISQKPCRKVRETLAKETGLSVRIVQVWFQNQRAKLKKIQRKQQQQQMSCGGNGLIGIGNGSESGGGIGSSDKSKDFLTDDSTDDDDDDESQQFSMPLMNQSPDADSFYSGRGDEDGYTIKSEIGGMDDSETSFCELDDGMHRPNSASDHRITTSTPINLLPFNSPSLMPIPGHHHPSDLMMSNSFIVSPSLQQPPHPPSSSTLNMFSQPIHNGSSSSNHLAHPLHISSVPSSASSSTSVSCTNMTPIDKLYSMQNSYFNNQSECEC